MVISSQPADERRHGRYLLWANKAVIQDRTGPPLIMLDRLTDERITCTCVVIDGPSWFCNAITEDWHPITPTVVWLETDGPLTAT